MQALNLQPAEALPQGDRLYLDERQGHVSAARAAYADQRIYRWLLSKRL